LRQFTALLGASDGSLWIGTSHGLGRLKDGQFHSHSKPGDRWGIFSIIEDHTGHIWVTRYHLSPGKGAICEAVDHGLHCYGQADGVPLPYGLGLAEDSQGNFWIGSRHLCRWKPGSACAIYFNNPALDDTALVASGPSQTILVGEKIGSPESGLQRFFADKWSPYALRGFDGSVVGAEAILFDRDGSLWVGTEKVGLYRIHNGVVDHYGPADGLSGHHVADLYARVHLASRPKGDGLYAAGGYRATVRRIIEIEKQQLPWKYVDPAELVYEYAVLGDRDEAFRWLEKAYQERSRSLQTMQIEPSMDALRSDSRYLNLLRRMGLAG